MLSKHSLALIMWNCICLAIPLWFYFTPSPEQSMARAVVLVFIAGPAAIIAFGANVLSVIIARSYLGILLAFISGAIACIWFAAVLTS